MARQIYKIRKTISMKRFISELGGNFSKHIKERLLDLEVRCVLTRDKDNQRLDIKHVEHLKNDSDKEYVYGQFLVVDDNLYFSEKCLEKDTVMESPIVEKIYNSLNTEEFVNSDSDSDSSSNSHIDIPSKKIDDSNIDFIIDSILESCPDISEKYRSIVNGMIYRANK